MMHLNNRVQSSAPTIERSIQAEASIYTREQFRAILARQPEWKVRAALEEGNIPSSNIAQAIEWLEEQAVEHRGYWS
ncbi:hypothetical protein [Massilia sp. LjRoot122]|uniref:hypothetical protein n=1 Tax=Massilia sp. LjRoot122 TaxID=3342257 RepID=UPI003ECCEDE7